MTPVVQFPHDVSSQVSITSLPTVGNEPNEEVVTIDLEPDLLQGASQEVIPSTSTGITSSQTPITDPASVISAKTKPKGQAAKKQHHLETLDSNTAQKYVDMVENEPVSKAAKTSNFPSYLFNPPPTTLGLEELRKHGIISDIEKNRAVTRFFNKATVLVPLFHNVLWQMDKSQTGQTNTDHDYQVPQPD